MRYLYLSLSVFICFLEVHSQQLPENIDYSSNQLRIANSLIPKDLKVVQGAMSNPNLWQNTPAILGKVDKHKSYTSFTPLVPFDLETSYTLVFNEQAFIFEIPRNSTDASLAVTGIYPTVPQIPANILKWYIKFSKAVNPIKIYDHIQFFDQNDQPINRSILNLAAPLLSADGTLLTVWIEPGRQKRGLGPHKHLGGVFEPSKNYTLKVADTLKDAEGLPIEKAVLHHFTTLESDREKPTIAQWQVMPIEAQSQKPLQIHCQESLDYGSLLDAFSVLFEDHQIEGTLSYDDQSKTIYFTPSTRWKSGSYTINIALHLEDLAGNSLGHLFDRPIQEDDGVGPEKELSLTVESF